VRRPPRGDAGAPQPSEGATTIRSAARMLWVFHQLVRTPGGQQLSEISRGLGLSEVTVLRLLRTLVQEGFVRKDPERGRYRMSPMFWLAALAGFPDVRDIQYLLLRTLDGLAEYASATACLVLPYVGLRSMGVAAVGPRTGAPGPFTATVKIPMHAIAGGKCYLASLPDDELEAWLRGGLPSVTSCTIVDPKVLTHELRQVRAQGYGVDREECVLGLCCVAVGVVDSSGMIAGALQLAFPARDFSEARAQRWLPRLQSAARSFSQALSSLAQLGA